MRENIIQEAHNILEKNTHNGCLDKEEVRKDLDIIAEQPMTTEERELFNTEFARAYIRILREEKV